MRTPLWRRLLKREPDDFNFDGDVFEISTDPNELGTVRDALEKAGYSFLSAEVEYVPQTMSTIEDEETAAKWKSLLICLKKTTMFRRYGTTGICPRNKK